MSDPSVVALTNISPDSYFGKVSDTDPDSVYPQRQVIYKAYDTLVLGPSNQIPDGGMYFNSVAQGSNLTVQAMELVLTGTLTLPRADVQIYCRKLTTLAGIPVTIDVSAKSDTLTDKNVPKPKVIDEARSTPIPGANGDTIASSWARGEDTYGSPPNPPYLFSQTGEDGGSITIICDEVNLASKLTLTAKGRDGYSGCYGQDGGPNSNPNLPGGRGGDGQAGGDGGNGGSILFQYRTDSAKNLNAMLSMSADGGGAGLPGLPGKGYRGAATGNSPIPAFAGEGGGPTLLPYSDLATLGAAFDEIFLLKAVYAAKLFYLQNQPTAFSVPIQPLPESIDPTKKLRDKFSWLVGCLTQFKPTSTDATGASRKSNLYQMANAYNLRISATPPYTSFNTVASSIPGWNVMEINSHDKSTILGVIESTYLYGGTGTLQALGETRTAYETAFSALLKAETSDEAQTASLNMFTVASDNYLAQYKSIVDLLSADKPGGLSKQLTDATDRLSRAISVLQTNLSDVQTTLENHFNCNLKNILSAIPQMMFVVSDPPAFAVMGGAIAGSTILDGFSQINDNSGNAIDKSQIIKSVKTLALDKDQTLASGVRGALFKPDGNGGFTLSDTATSTLAQLSSLEDQLSDLSNSLDADHPGEMETIDAAIEEFKNAIVDRSTLQITFLNYTAAAASAWQNYKEAARQIDVVNSKPNLMTPDMIGMVSHMGMVYQDALFDFVSFTSDFKRHVAWLTLNNSNSPESNEIATQLSSAWMQGSFPSPDDLSSIDQNLKQDCNTLTSYFLNVDAPSFPTPSKTTLRPDDLIAVIDSPELLKSIRATLTSGKPGTPIKFILVPDGAAKTLAKSSLSVVQAISATPVKNLDLRTTDNSFQVTVNGIASGSLVLDKQNYASVSALATGVQSVINKDPALVLAGISVSVSYYYDTTRYGTDPCLCISARSSLGFCITATSPDLGKSIGFKATTRGIQVMSCKVTSLDLSSSNNSFSVAVNGQVKNNLSLAQRNYTSGDDLASAIQALIGTSVLVGYDSDSKELDFLVTSGASPSFQVMSASANMTAAIGLAPKFGTSQTLYYYQAPGSTPVAIVECSASHKFWDIRVTAVQPRIIGAKYTGTNPSTSLPQSPNDKRPQAISVKISAHPTRLFWSERTSASPTVNHLEFTHPSPRTANFEHYWVTDPQDVLNDDIAGADGTLVDGGLSPLGIFGIWTLSLNSWSRSTDYNADIDFSSVTSIQLGFTGTMRSIS